MVLKHIIDYGCSLKMFDKLAKRRKMNGELYTLTLRIEIKNSTGILAKVTASISETGGNIGAIDTVSITKRIVTRDITIAVSAEQEAKAIIQNLRLINGVKIRQISNPIFLAHLKGKLEIVPRHPLKNRMDLSYIYTPGVAKVCQAIVEDPQMVRNLTIKGNSVAIVTDGSRVLGLGNIGPEASLPVMEGKAMIFKIFADIDAFPLPLATQDAREIIRVVECVSPVFGGINLEDISSPRCFKIETALREGLNIPVFHDDQHGTAVVTLAGLINALKLVGKNIAEARIIINGAGAAGLATAKLLHFSGAKNLICCDTAGIIYRTRETNMNRFKEWIAQNTNPDKLKGDLSDAMKGANVFIGLSSPNALTVPMAKSMSSDSIIFALANPTPEIDPTEASKIAAVVATGRSDFPNQINNALCFPGFFRGLLNTGARRVTDQMKLAAAQAIASLVKESHLNGDYIIPSIFDKRVVPRVAKAVMKTVKS